MAYNLSWMQILLMITTFLIPAYIFRLNIFGVPSNIFEFAVAISLIVSLFHCFIAVKNNGATEQRSNEKFVKIYKLLLLIFIFSTLISLVVANFSPDALGIVKSWVIVPIIYGWLIYRNFNKSNYIKIALALYTSVIVVSVWALLQKLGFITTLFYQVGDLSFNQYLGSTFRAFGPFESPNYLAMFLVPASIIAIGTISKPRIAFYLSFLLPLMALIFSRSRAGIIALIGAAGVCATILIYRKMKNKRHFVVFTILSIILYSLFIILFIKFAFRPESDAIRFEIYRYAWLMIRQHWLLGIGTGNFQQLLGTYNLSDNFRSVGLPAALHPHNLYFAMWLYFGLLGLISFLALGIIFFRQVLSRQANMFLAAAMTAILIHGIFDTTYFKNDLAAIFWLIFFVAFVPEKEGE